MAKKLYKKACTIDELMDLWQREVFQNDKFLSQVMKPLQENKSHPRGSS